MYCKAVSGGLALGLAGLHTLRPGGLAHEKGRSQRETPWPKAMMQVLTAAERIIK